MATLTVENYVKAIYQITGGSKTDAATTGELAKRLKVSPGSVTSMLRTLADSGLADYQAYEGVRLTDSGRRLALRILRRHRLVELFLVDTLGLTWDEVHEEAEHIEHAVSDRLVDRIDEFLGRPERDPHGDPIPSADGSVQSVESQPLVELGEGTGFAVVRVIDQSPDFLRYLSGVGLSLGGKGVVSENNPHSGAVVLNVDQQPATLGRDAASKILVRRDG